MHTGNVAEHVNQKYLNILSGSRGQSLGPSVIASKNTLAGKEESGVILRDMFYPIFLSETPEFSPHYTYDCKWS